VGDDTSYTTSGKGNNASSTTVETCLRINNGNDAIVTRAKIAILTMAKTPVHQQRQCQLANKQQGQ
jgi:hypothetical protein